MIKIPENIQKVLGDLYIKTSPVSIFIYGSRARKDFIKSSDYEIGILYKPDKKISRSDLAKKHSIKDLRLYPFDYNEFIQNKLDTPFPKAVYMRGLIAKAKTLYGEKIVENMALPHIYLIDLLEEAVFQISRAYTAMLSQRENDNINARSGFIKSVLFGTRTLLILKKNTFPIEFDQIIKESESLKLHADYNLLIKHALEVRNGKKLEPNMFYKNISFLNQVVIKEIKDALKFGDKMII